MSPDVPMPRFGAHVSMRLRGLGIDPDEVWRRAKVVIPLDERLVMTTTQFIAAFEAMKQLGAPREFGFDLVPTPALHQLDIASLAAVHSETVADALRILARYKRLTCPEILDIQTITGGARIVLSWLDSPAPPPAMLIDSSMALLLRLLCIGLGETASPIRIELTRERCDIEWLKERMGCRDVVFGAVEDAIVLDSALLRRRLLTYNKEIVLALLPGLEENRIEHEAGASLPLRVRTILQRRLRGRRPTINDVATDLLVSTRTLQRRLGEAGTTYQRLLDEVRHESAVHLLTSTDLVTGEVSFLLGFEEINSFTRAFQEWEGMTPTRWKLVRSEMRTERPAP